MLSCCSSSLSPSLLFHTLSSVTPVEAERSREYLIRTPASIDTRHTKVKEGDVRAVPSMPGRRARPVMNRSFSCSFYICSASSACLLTCLASSYFYKEVSCERGRWSKWLKIATVVLVKQGQPRKNGRRTRTVLLSACNSPNLSSIPFTILHFWGIYVMSRTLHGVIRVACTCVGVC